MTLPTPTWLRRAGLAALVVAPLLVLGACDGLDVDPFSQVEIENFYRTPSEVEAAVAPIYGAIRPTLFNYYNLSQVSTDENIVPTRGSDWGDGGRWLAIHRHGWDSNLSDANGAWTEAFTGIARANKVLEDINDLTIPDKEELTAELRAMRAYFYYQILDLFGRAPIIGDEPGEFSADLDNPPSAASRAEVFAFIESELLAARPLLAQTQVDAGGRISQDAVDAILANLYINCEIFRGTLTAGGITRGAACWAQAEERANNVISSGRYQLAPDYFSVFQVNNADNPEHIFRVEHLAAPGLGLTLPMRMTHYNQFAPSPWNGFATLAETYDQFDEDDARRDMFLTGPQVSFEDGQPVTDRNGNPLVFTADFPNGVENTTEGGGFRLLKYQPDVNHVSGNHGNDFSLFRLGEMHLIRAEAAFRRGNTTQALADINALRARAGLDPISSLDDATLLQERLFELAGEAKRRQDLVRIEVGGVNQFTRPYFEKGQSEPYRVFYPIPQSQLDANPNLTQNPGY
ncbi:MAG: RagB/SusD family nutrient uptake outer membrane protein [Bacteroidota bacterium]